MKLLRPCVLGLLLGALGGGCSSCNGAEERDSESPSGVETDEDEGPGIGTGVVEGVVRLAEGQELPSYPPRAVGRTAERPERPPGCPPPKQAELQPVKLGEGRGLHNVLVAASGFSKKPAHTPTTHRVRIEDCTLTPPVVAATRGDQLEVENHTDSPFLPTLGSSNFTQALLKGQSRTLELSVGLGVRPLTCTFAAPCGRTDVIIQAHPVHTLTGEDGRFRMDNVPAGEKVTVHAWHPLFRDAGQKVTAAEDGAVEVTLTLRVAARPAIAPAGPTDRGPDGGIEDDEADALAPDPDRKAASEPAASDTE